MDELEKLIKKYNNIEKNTGFVERYYYFGGKNWFVGRTMLFCNHKRADEKEIKEFLKLKKENLR